MDGFYLFDAFGDRRPAGFLTPAFSLSVLNIRIGFKYLDRSRLPDVQTETLRMAVKLRCVHALYRGHACLVFSLVLDTGTVFEDIHALRQIVHEKVRRSVARTLVVAHTVLVTVAAKNVDRFGAAAPLVFEVDVFHIAIHPQFDAYDQLVAHGKLTFDRIPNLAPSGCFLG